MSRKKYLKAKEDVGYCTRRKNMKVYTREELVKRLKICTVIGLIMIPVFVATQIMIETPLIVTAGCVVLGIVAFPFSVFAMSFNFGKMMLGMIAPIPILSYFIEIFKGWGYAIKGLIVIFKNKDQLVIGSE